MDRKLEGGLRPFGEGELGPNLTQCDQGRGLPPTKLRLDTSSRSATIDRAADYTDAGKACVALPASLNFESRGAMSLSVGELGLYLAQCGRGAEAYLYAKFHLDPSNRLATVHQRQRQSDRQTDRTDNGPMAQGEPFLQTVAQKQ